MDDLYMVNDHITEINSFEVGIDCGQKCHHTIWVRRTSCCNTIHIKKPLKANIPKEPER